MKTVMPVIVCKKYYKKRFTKNKTNVSLYTLFKADVLSQSCFMIGSA